jgi:hypothetical protein
MQLKLLGSSFTAPFTVLRLLTPLGMSYATAKKRAEPYTKIVEELPTMRREAVQLVRQAVGAGRRGSARVCPGQQSGGRQRAVDHAGTCGDDTRGYLIVAPRPS